MSARQAAAAATKLRGSLLSPPPCTCIHLTATSPSSVASTATPASPSQLRHGYSTASAALAPEPALEFLYPSFGFFSRALPPAPAASASASLEWLSPVSAGGGGRTWSRRAGQVAVGRCSCGRVQSSCLRCRPNSTSAKPTHHHPSQHLNVDAPSISLNIPLSPSPTLQDSPAPPTLDLATLPARIARLTKLSTHKFNSKIALAKGQPSLQTYQDELDLLWHAFAPSIADASPAPALALPLEPTDQLDLTRLFVRLPDRFAPLPAQSPVLSRKQSEDLTTELADRKATRREAGRRALALAGLFVPEPQADVPHARSWAALRLEARCLLDDLPALPAARPFALSPAELSTFERDLLRVFPDPNAAATQSGVATLPTSLLTTSAVRAQLGALGALLGAWERSPSGPGEAVEFMSGWGLDRLFALKQMGAEGWVEAHVKIGNLLRRRYGDLLRRLEPSPAMWAAEQLDRDDRDSPLSLIKIGPHLTKYLADTEGGLEALGVWELIQGRAAGGPRMGRSVELETLTSLVNGLVFVKQEEDANRVSKRLQSMLRSATAGLAVKPNVELTEQVIDGHRALAKLAAARGRPAKVQEILGHLQSIGWDGGTEGVARKMRASAQLSDLDEVMSLYDQGLKAFPQMTKKERGQLGTELVRSHVRLDDVEGGVRTLASLLRVGDSPPLALVVTLLHGLARRRKVAEAYDLFSRLPEFGLLPTVAAFLPLTSLHASLAEPETIERLMADMLSVGVEPDLRVWTCLMGAYVNARQWRPALAVYTFLEANEDPKLRPDTATTNVLLKATVLAGVSAMDSLQLFRQAVARGIRPNAQTYTLVLQAVCNAGLMDLAEELFTLMDAKPDAPPDGQAGLPRSMTAVEPDVFVFSILIKGYLDKADAVKAQACLQEMRARGIDPSSVTYGIIVGSLVEDRSEVGIKKAQQLAHSFLSTDPDLALLRRHRRPATFDKPYAAGEEALSVVSPILNAFAKKADADAALNIFRHALHDGVRPSVPLYTSMMDAYRRANSTENVKRVFDTLHEVYLETYPATEADRDQGQEVGVVGSDLAVRRVAKSHAGGMCYALSVYIEAHMGKDHLPDLKLLWRRMVAEGFTFDAGNWNALALALVYAGQVGYAFKVAELVLCRPPGDDPGGQADAKQLRFGPADRQEALLFTNLRLHRLRQSQIHAHTRRPSRMSVLLDPRVMSGEESVDARAWMAGWAGDVLARAEEVRLASHWFVHGSVVDALAKALAVLAKEERRGTEGAGEYRSRLVAGHPKAVDAIWRRRWAKARAYASGGIRESSGPDALQDKEE